MGSSFPLYSQAVTLSPATDHFLTITFLFLDVMTTLKKAEKRRALDLFEIFSSRCPSGPGVRTQRPKGLSGILTLLPAAVYLWVLGFSPGGWLLPSVKWLS